MTELHDFSLALILARFIVPLLSEGQGRQRAQVQTDHLMHGHPVSLDLFAIADICTSSVILYGKRYDHVY